MHVCGFGSSSVHPCSPPVFSYQVYTLVFYWFWPVFFYSSGTAGTASHIHRRGKQTKTNRNTAVRLRSSAKQHFCTPLGGNAEILCETPSLGGASTFYRVPTGYLSYTRNDFVQPPAATITLPKAVAPPHCSPSTRTTGIEHVYA